MGSGGYSYIEISYAQLLLSIILVLITGIISALLQLGLIKSLLWGTVRAFVQLTLIGYVLSFIFKLDNWAVILLIILLMCYIASREASRRIKKPMVKPDAVSFLALTASTFLVGMIVVVFIVAPDPWYTPQVMIPIFGMILGNSMNGIALALDRMYGEIYGHLDEVEQLLALGATPFEAVRDYVKEALRAGMTPTINSLMVVGLVSLPGMMTGQILAGMDPAVAVRYQFVVMVMIAAAVAMGCLIIVGLSYRSMFNEDMALNEKLYRNN
ncbi:putative ABC transport system permease protein [Thermosyntropha lipolytica DSM 11003]|uniref:Putative ABC transport system permease protein n=1 Tax=Thermosyntropha lipolytica DSM 11003 TaxID=1123382 RepID=A0A1M5JH73_9FIRM|nr:iron export ABC transporter permease subunit FetB [Thermosyntropha lipolytica]SHG39881.1 putative ABC transport system permease protein [Thermosyntropha lipolytica DSM 11003]